MRNLFLMITAVMMISAAGCSRIDDSAANGKHDSFEQRRTATQTVMKAYENNILIESVQRTDNGYIITFSDGSAATIADSLGNGDKNNGYTLIESIVVGENEVTFLMSDGSAISVAFRRALSITFGSGTWLSSPDATYDIPYTVHSFIPEVELHVFSSAGIQADIVERSEFEGVIHIATGATLEESDKAVIFVSNGEKMIVHGISFERRELHFYDNADKTLFMNGGMLTLEFLAGVECEAVIPNDAQGWITPAETRSAGYTELNFRVAANDGDTRRADIAVRSSDGTQSVTYHVGQFGREDAEQERQVLIAIYNANDGDDRTSDYENWCSDKPLNQWAGVHTDAQGHVDALSLEHKRLKRLPPETGNLVYLKYLNLKDNHLTSIPPETGNLAGLTSLDLSYNQLASLPAEIGGLTNLRELELNNNKFTYIPAEAGSLARLTSLNLNDNQIAGSLPDELGNLTMLTYLGLRSSNLAGIIPESMNRVPAWLMQWGDIVAGSHLDLENSSLYAPRFRVTDVNGAELTAESFYAKNSYTILHKSIFGSAGPALKNLYTQYHDAGVDIISYSYFANSCTSLSQNVPWRVVLSSAANPVSGDDIPYYANYPSEIWLDFYMLVDSRGKVVCADSDLERLSLLLAVKLSGLDIYESTDFSQDGNVRVLQRATEGKGIDIFLIGDAFSDRQIAAGTYDEVMDEVFGYLFLKEPFASFRRFFNVYAVTAVSRCEGYEYGSTALSGYFSEGTLVGGDDNTALRYAQSVRSAGILDATIIVIMNDKRYAGTCYMYNAGWAIAYCPLSRDIQNGLKGLILHEACGHGFGRLADEYYYPSNGTIPDADIIKTREGQNERGWWKNVDFTNDLSSIRWSRFVSDPRYAAEGIGAYEGGRSYSKGIWRPAETSIMRTNAGEFNAPSREAIYYRIHKLAYGNDWVYDYEDFATYDAINRTAAVRTTTHVPEDYVPLHPPVVVE